MKLQFLGTGGFHPNERRHTACVWLPEHGVVFDAGSSVFRIPSRLQTDELQVFLSHAHLDHICGLTFLLTPLLLKSLKRCRVYAQPDIIAAVEAHLFCKPIFPIRPAVEFIPLSPVTETPAGRVTWLPLHHPGGSTGYRIDMPDGRSLAYITDTTANPDSIPFLSGLDLLIHECNYPDSMAQWCEPTGHSHASQVAHIAAAAKVSQLYLTHFDPQLTSDDPINLASTRAIFPETYLAEDLLELDL
ncbi:metal-dependent hydrolase [bacterium]|nr:metal-dependent hydrolase [bacterium]